MTAASEARRALKRRRMWWLARINAAVLSAGLIALVWAAAVDNAPSVQADELPRPPKVSAPAPVAGPTQPIFDFADVTPWDPGKEPGFVAGSASVERPRTTSRVVAAQEAADGSETPGPVPVDPPNGSEPTGGDDPLHDDGEFGDGCEQPGTREQCDPDLTPPVGLPPVVVPGDVEAEQPPIEEPAEEEPPVDEAEDVVVETVTEVTE